jgi:hypothetical protein
MNDQQGHHPGRRWAATLLARAMPVAAAVVTLAAAPAAGATPAAPSTERATASTTDLHANHSNLGDDQDHCNVASPSGALNPMKWPLCAGD